jgi:hypothetical protein
MLSMSAKGMHLQPVMDCKVLQIMKEAEKQLIVLMVKNYNFIF